MVYLFIDEIISKYLALLRNVLANRASSGLECMLIINKLKFIFLDMYLYNSSHY